MVPSQNPCLDTLSRQVSEMCARHLHEMIIKEGDFDSGDLEGAVRKGYMALDTYLLR